MKLLTKEIRAKLIANGREQAKVKGTKAEKDFWPVVKLFYPADRDVAAHRTRSRRRGCGLGLLRSRHGVSGIRDGAHQRTEGFDGPAGLRIERDRFFEAKAPISRYIDAADDAGYITEKVASPRPPTVNHDPCHHP